MNDLHVTEHGVGDWDGQEQLAADQFNRIVDALAVHFTMDDLADRVHYAWDHWGSEEELLTITNEKIREYVSNLF